MRRYSITDGVSLRDALSQLHQDLLLVGLDESCFFRCKLVFSELASNAAKHMPRGGEIKVELFEERVEIVLSGEKPFRLPEISNCSPVYAESGRGLYLIDSVCQSRENTANGVKVVLIRNR
ncbi:MAG: hypothetical protein IJY11_03880 [Clostridia bacterium]|nr:hypothetical protein [Clostridia bacterium]